MFAFLSVVFSLALFSFGAVQPHRYLFLNIIWLCGTVGLLSFELYKGRRLNIGYLLYLGFCAFLQLLSIKLALGFIAAGWAWFASGRSLTGTLRFFKFLVVVGLLEALLGLVQYFLLPGWILGYQNPYSVSSGTLVNRNHFAGLLEMVIPIALGFAYIAFRFGENARSYIYLILGAFLTVALVFSMSRMGIVSFVVTLLMLGATLRLRDSQRKAAAGLTMALMGMVIALVVWVGVDVVIERFALLTSEDSLLQEGRVVVFADTAKMILAKPGGVGAGNYVDAFRQYQTFHPELLFDHAHNDYLEFAADWGIMPAILFWLAVVVVLVSAYRRLLVERSIEKAGVLLACVGAVFSLLIHSLTDFNLQIPSNAVLFFSLVGIAFRQAFNGENPPL